MKGPLRGIGAAFFNRLYRAGVFPIDLSLIHFFEAWSEPELPIRRTMMDAIVTDDLIYEDPTSQGTLTGKDAVCAHMEALHKTAPGTTVTALTGDATDRFCHALVGFDLPDGSREFGTYFAVKDGNKISKLAGFRGYLQPKATVTQSASETDPFLYD